MRTFFLLAIFCSLPAQAERFVLQNGSTVQGTLLNADESPRVSYQIRLEKGGDVTLDADAVKKVIVPSPEKRKYDELLARLPAETAENHWKMAEQCAKWSLGREREFHLEQTIRLEPNHAQAHRALKHKQRKDGTWAPLNEIMEEAGKVRQDGRWVSKQEAQLIASDKERRAAEIQWKKKLKMWKGWLADRSRQDNALKQLAAIDDPTAVVPLVELFRSNKNANLREALAEVLGKFNHSEATQALVEASLFGSRELQMQCIHLLEKNGQAAVVKQYLPSLQSTNNQLVRRAGYALGVLGDDQVILPLIKALNTTHTRLVGGAGNGGINYGRGGLSAGQTKPKKVDQTKTNKEVRSALVKLTGEDFDYNEQRWLDWYLARSTPPRLDLRREE